MWGHYTSADMITWNYEGVGLFPDQPFDCHGVYSGSAFVEDGKLYLYYIGNVKLEDGAFDISEPDGKPIRFWLSVKMESSLEESRN